MPHLFSFANHGSDDAMQEMDHELPHKPPRRPSVLKNIGSLLKRHHHEQDLEPCPQTAPTESAPCDDYFPVRRHSLKETTSTRKPIPSLPRPQTFRRQESERREKLLQVEPSPTERRALSADRRGAFAGNRPKSPRPRNAPFASAPQVGQPDELTFDPTGDSIYDADAQKQSRHIPANLPPLQIPDQQDDGPEVSPESDEAEIDHASLQEEYERRWILNLSMHFRDKSNREKFFVTYAEAPTRWRRVTVSLDYRNAPEGSLEHDLSTLHYQRDKSFRIYEAIRESLPDIQYYETVTNLKLETTPEDGQLHVHVREDANEIIQYPSVSLFQHVRAQTYSESEVEFISHLSGFVYKVRTNGRIVIKKEIPGPDTIDEFLYEVNALDALRGCDNVVQLEGLVTDDTGSVVKGLLISYASQGALVDILYDFRGELSWHRREKWAKQIVQGLSEIHEAGFVQGDFTLSNIVIDEDDNAQIIDINRRGCPVGWEPPELGRLIDSGQRISMCISVKTDVYQLGMVLWALAEEVDEPERMERPLPPVIDSVPSYFRRMIDICLSDRPQSRKPAKRLLKSFPASAGLAPSYGRPSVDFTTEFIKPLENGTSTHRADKEYIDPKYAVTLEEVRRRRNTGASDFTSGQVTYMDPDSNAASTTYPFESSDSWVMGRRRGRSPVSSRHRRSPAFGGRTASSATSLSSDSSPARCPTRGNSCDSVDEKAGKSAVSLRYPPPLDESDLKLPTVEIAAVQASPSQEEQETATPTVPDVTSYVSAWDEQHIRQLLHTDSGFDEHMVEDLELEAQHPVTSTTSNKLEQEHMDVHEQLEIPKLAHTAAVSAAIAEGHEGRVDTEG